MYHFLITNRCSAKAVTKKVGDLEMIVSWDVEKHTHISAIEENWVTKIMQKHKLEATLNPNINPHKVYSDINAEVAQTGGGVLCGSQKSLAGNIHRRYYFNDKYLNYSYK